MGFQDKIQCILGVYDVIHNARTLKYKYGCCIHSANLGGLCWAEMLCVGSQRVLRRILYNEGTKCCVGGPKCWKARTWKGNLFSSLASLKYGPSYGLESPRRLWQFCLHIVTVLAVSSEGEGRGNSWYCPQPWKLLSKMGNASIGAWVGYFFRYVFCAEFNWHLQHHCRLTMQLAEFWVYF